MMFEQESLVPTLQHAYDRGYAAGLKREADLLAAIDRVLALHVNNGIDERCKECGYTWPCETVRAVEG